MWHACRLYYFYIGYDECWCSNDGTSGNLVNITTYGNANYKVGYSEC